MIVELPIALVTGGAHRIGRAIVEDLAGHGWSVIIHYNRSGTDADRVARTIRSGGGKAATVAADLGDPESTLGLIAQASDIFGKVDVLVNNASIFEGDEIGNLSSSLYHKQMTINLTSPLFLAQAFANALAEGRQGNIVNIIDQRVWRPTPRFFSYHLSKAALWAATQTMAQAFAPRIRVNAIGPGPTMKNEGQSEEMFRQQTEAVLLGHGADLTEFGRTVRYFVDNGSVTGQMIALDGGQHLGWATPDNADFDG